MRGSLRGVRTVGYLGTLRWPAGRRLGRLRRETPTFSARLSGIGDDSTLTVRPVLNERTRRASAAHQGGTIRAGERFCTSAVQHSWASIFCVPEASGADDDAAARSDAEKSWWAYRGGVGCGGGCWPRARADPTRNPSPPASRDPGTPNGTLPHWTSSHTSTRRATGLVRHLGDECVDDHRADYDHKHAQRP
jgi:hypothetical protein